VTRAAVGVLFLRSTILQSLKSNVSDREMLASLLDVYRDGQQEPMRGSLLPIQSAPCEVRRQIFARMREAAAAHDIDSFIPHPENSNHMTAEMLRKLRRHIERTRPLRRWAIWADLEGILPSRR
jgi:hypothetical protein